MSINVSESLKTKYDEYYDDKQTPWRELGAKFKVENIVTLRAAIPSESINRVLECGAGEGSILKFLDQANFCNALCAVEISNSGVQRIRDRNLNSLTEVLPFNGYDIPYADDDFDLSITSHVIEHVEHPRILLRELKRVSRYQIFEIPLDYAIGVDEKVQELTAYGHINVFTPSLFRFLLKSEGFEIIADHLTEMPLEIIRYQNNVNPAVRKSWIQGANLSLLPFKRTVKKLLRGKRQSDEFAYAAYSVLTK